MNARLSTRFVSVAALLLSAAAALPAQENPLNISTTVYTGFYTTSTKGEANQSLTFVPVGARFDIDGFLFSPDLLSFSVQPEVAAGPQASDAGIQGGDGVRLRFTLLRKRAFPLTFRYSNVQVQDVYFGSLSQVSGYRLQNRNKDIGVTWELKPAREMAIIFDWGKGSVDSKSDLQQVPDYVSNASHINLDAQYTKAGWDFRAYGHRQDQRSNLLLPIQGNGPAGELIQKVQQAQASARRTLFGDSEFYVDGGIQSTSTMLLTMPIDLTNRYGSMSVRLRQRHRWKTSIRAAYSSNIASQLLAQAAANLTAPGSTTPDTNVLVPFSHGMSSLNLNATTSAEIAWGLGVYGSIERNEILTTDQSAPLNSSYFMATAGLNYSHKFDWGTINGQYGRELGYGSITGQTGTIEGQVYRMSAIHSTSGGITFEGGVHGSNQSVKNVQPLSNDSISVDGSIGFKILSDINARFGGGWQNSSYVNSGNEFRTNGYTVRASVDHPRYQFSFSLNDSLSNSLPIYAQLLGLDAAAVPLQIIPSDYHSISFAAHAYPLKKVEVSASWTHSQQHLDGILSNDFELLNALLTYHFRKLQLESGYIKFNQVFANYPSLNRTRFYVRVQKNGPYPMTTRIHILALLAAAPAALAYTPTRGTVDYLKTIPSVKEFTKPRKLLPKLINWIAGPPEDKPEVIRPYATAHDSIGRLLVADPGQQGVHIYDFEKHKYQFVKGKHKDTLVSPIDIACDGQDNIYVSDSVRQRIFVFDSKGKYQRSIGAGQLKRPTGMFLDKASKRIYLADTLRHQVIVYGLDGSYVQAIGQRGNGNGEFNYPTALTVAGGQIYVVDSMNFRIQTLTADGQFVSSFGQLGNRSGSLNRPKGIAVDTDGNIYIVDALFETVQVFDPSGHLLHYFGSGGREPGQFQLPSGISIDDRNVIYVADSMNHRVQVFHYRRLGE